MLIPVIYTNGKHDMVKDFMLSRLIENRDIEQFKRSEGWINIRTDPLRAEKPTSLYDGPERRQAELEEAASSLQ